LKYIFVKIKMICSYKTVFMVLLALTGCRSASSEAQQMGREYTAFGNPERITIRGYSGHAMEPFITRDGGHLLFNNSNDPSVNTNLYYAERIDDVTFEYKGEILGVNSEALDAVPTMDRDGNLYFVSTRSYKKSLSTIYSGRVSGRGVHDVALVAGLSEKRPGHLNFDVEVSADGNTLYLADGIFSGKPVPDKSDIAIAVRDKPGFRHLPQSADLLKNINSQALEYAACISPNDLELFFTRLGKSGPAIYRSTRKAVTEPFEPPVQVAAIEG